MLHDLVFLHAHHYPRCTARVAKYFEGYFCLQLMSEGGVELSYDAQRYELSGVWLWSSFPGPHIRFHAGAGCQWWNHRYAAFTGSLVERWINEDLWPRTPCSIPESTLEAWQRRFDELLLNIARADRWGQMRAINVLEAMLLDLAEARGAAQPREAWLEQVFAYLQQTDSFTPDYARVASSCGMGLSTLRRRFRTATGQSLHEWVLQQRLARARQMLGETDWPIKAIAEKLGYNDVFFFTNQFRKHAGISPAAYRKSRQLT
jgi:AraC-like DNA-binding protein